MRLVTSADIEVAAERIAGITARIPLLPQQWSTERPLWLKPESLHAVGSFKIRGAYNAAAALDRAQRSSGIVTYSSGNHACALAWAGRLLGIPTTVVTQDSAPQVKIAAAGSYGARIVSVPMTERESEAHRLAETYGLRLIPPFDDHDIIAGQATIGQEISQELPELEVVLVPIGGGGLASGVGTAVKALRPAATVVGVEPELAAVAAHSLREGRLADWPAESRARTVADGLRTQPSPLTFAHLRAQLDGVITVTETEIRETVRALALRARLVAEPSGAVATAAALFHSTELPHGRTVAIVSGGNIDARLLAELLGQTSQQ